jgi:hypothetical protein
MTIEEIAEALDFLGDARKAYLHGVPEPQTAADLDAMRPMDLHIFIESQTAKKLAAYLRNPEDAWGWLPTWLTDEWQPHAQKIKGDQP